MRYAVLIIFLSGFWAAVAFYPTFVSLRVGGPASFVPVFASTFSIILAWCAIGTLLNLLYPWLGTYAVGAVHVAILVLTIGCVLRRR